MTKSEALTLQTFLKNAGFDPGPLDGLWGKSSQRAEDAWKASTTGVVLGRVGYNEIRSLRGAVYWVAGMTIDADGDPKCYHPLSRQGLDDLACAGKPGNWWGVATDDHKSNGTPVVQGDHDPAPGYYVSTTALEDPNYDWKSPSRYVNSGRIPFAVIPGIGKAKLGEATVGDLATVLYKGRVCHAVVGDVGPSDHLGEASIACAQALGIESNPRHGGVPSGVTYIIYPDSGDGKPIAAADIEQRAAKLFAALKWT